jgi:hypothetical protein
LKRKEKETFNSILSAFLEILCPLFAPSQVWKQMDQAGPSDVGIQ